jgi:hypothetical protein
VIGETWLEKAAHRIDFQEARQWLGEHLNGGKARWQIVDALNCLEWALQEDEIGPPFGTEPTFHTTAHYVHPHVFDRWLLAYPSHRVEEGVRAAK